MMMKQNDAIRSSLHANLSGLTITRRRHNELIDNIVGGKPMKKKLTAGLALAIVLMVLTATAFAAYVLIWSPQADAESRARQALADAYGLTPETLGCFIANTRQDGDTWTVTFTGDGFNPGILGSYTVVITGGVAEASWTHDDVDRAEWENGGLSAPVWGQPQIAEALRNTEAANEAQAAFLSVNPTAPPTPNATPLGGPESFEEGTAWWNGEWIRIGTPGENDLTEEQAKEIAYQALMEEYGVTSEELDAGTVVSNDFYVRENGGTLWGIGINILKDGVYWGCGVTMDGATGEILMINVITGGNG
jgi:hypothetical protein